MKRNPDLDTPWANGNLLHSPGDKEVVGGEIVYPDVQEWRGNEEFEATLQLRGTERGRSAAFFRWEVVSGELPAGTLLPMFITDVGHVLMNGLSKTGGTATGRWFVVKRGQNYGVTPVVPVPDDTTAPRGQERPTGALVAPSGG